MTKIKEQIWRGKRISSIDLAAMAIQLGAGFVGRSFSGDKDQLVPLLKAAMKFKDFH